MHGIRFHLMTHTEKLCSSETREKETRELTAKEHHLMNIPKSESKKIRNNQRSDKTKFAASV